MRYPLGVLAEKSLAEVIPSLTERLRRFTAGDQVIADQVLHEVVPELHRVALRALSKNPGGPLGATELIHEFWLRKLTRGAWAIENRKHFFALAAYAMRQVLIELARQQNSDRHGGYAVVLSLNESSSAAVSRMADPEAVIHLGILMDQLEKNKPDVARIVDLHYFAGFTFEEITEITGLTFRQVRYLWKKGSDWLKDSLS